MPFFSSSLMNSTNLSILLDVSRLLTCPLGSSSSVSRAGALTAIEYLPVTLAFRALLLTSPLLLKISTTKCEGLVRLKLRTSPSRRRWSYANARQPGCRIDLSMAATVHLFPLGPSSVMNLPFWNVSG